MPAISTLVDRSVNTAHRRLFLQSFFNKLAVCTAVATGLALVGFVVQPLLIERPKSYDWVRWAGLAGLFLASVGAAIYWAMRTAPSRQNAALEVDGRFGLKERVTTAISLTPELSATPAGSALLADAEAKVKPLSVGEKFPVKARWTAALAPAFGLLIAVAALWWNPAVLAFGANDSNAGKKEGDKADDSANPKKEAAKANEKAKEEKPRENRSTALAELEAELKNLDNKFEKDPFDDTKEKNTERVADLTKLEEKIEKFNKEREQELKQLGDKLGELSKLSQDKDFDGGPADQLNDALAKGDLGKAEEEIDELKKKAKEKDLTPEDAKKLSKKLEKMKDELERLDRDKEEKKKELEKKKDQAKKENRDEDAAELDRELEKLKQEQEAGSEELKDLAQKLGRAKDALDKGDMEDAAEALEKAGKAVDKMQGEVEDLKDGEKRLQQLKSERKKACEACECEGDKPGKPNGKKSMNNKGGIGSGERDWNKDADTGSTEERVRSLMDLKGEQRFGGLTKGEGFTKKTDRELGKEIKKQAQDAPGSSDVQTLPRDARDSVTEYFKKLGGTEKK